MNIGHTLILLAALMLTPMANADDTFRIGADISGTTADEGHGRFTRDAHGNITETTQLMHDLGLNLVRLRVWVNPEDGYCSPDDVVRLAERAKALGMPVMIDFHYSDWWADPGKQNIPAAWKEMNYEEMCQALAEHTETTLQKLKEAGVDVRWVQIGNETTHGFLWPMGRTPENIDQYAGLTKAGAAASKSVFPDADVIIHLDNGFDQPMYDAMFDTLKERGVVWDQIGMSVYPYWAMEGGYCKDTDETISRSIANIRHLKERYGTDVMIVETGVDARNPAEGKQILAELLDAAYTQTDGACTGVIYWAPEINADADYHLGAFASDRPTAIMDAFTEFSRRHHLSDPK